MTEFFNTMETEYTSIMKSSGSKSYDCTGLCSCIIDGVNSRCPLPPLTVLGRILDTPFQLPALPVEAPDTTLLRALNHTQTFSSITPVCAQSIS